MPLILLLPLLFDLLTIGFVVCDVYLIHEWYYWHDTYRHDYAQYCLYGAIAITAYSLIGGMPYKYILSKRPKNADEPKPDRSSSKEMLRRPDGSVINIELMGNPQGQPVLFVHGWMANSTEWYYQKKHFAKDHRIILIDLAGLGLSKRPDNRDFSLQKLASDLDAVIQHLKLSNVILWGHSIGGMTILTYITQLSRNNPNVKGIILQHTTFTNPVYTGIASGFFKAIEKPVIVPLCYLMIGLSPLFWINKWMSYLNGHSHLSTRITSFAGTQTPGQLDYITRLSALSPPSVTARGMLGMMNTYDVSEGLKNITIPTLIIAADKDKLTKPVASEYMNKNIPASTMVMLVPGGHQGVMERHDEANAAAGKFIHSIRA
ncbi:MAG: alpha/beta hydrolase [Bacteroidetes bacterium]|nr:alpha/beta hydrolase [Bacteroidota bacterium]